MQGSVVSYPGSSATRNGGTPETWSAADLTYLQAVATTMFCPRRLAAAHRPCVGASGAADGKLVARLGRRNPQRRAQPSDCPGRNRGAGRRRSGPAYQRAGRQVGGPSATQGRRRSTALSAEEKFNDDGYRRRCYL